MKLEILLGGQSVGYLENANYTVVDANQVNLAGQWNAPLYQKPQNEYVAAFKGQGFKIEAWLPRKILKGQKVNLDGLLFEDA